MRPAALARKGVSGLAALMAAPAALLLAPGRAEAILVYNIFDSGPSQVTLQASGSINPASPPLSGVVDCSSSGKVDSNNAILCIGQNLSSYYAITGPTSFLPQDVFLTTASITGKLFILDGPSRIYIDPTYTNNDPISSSAIFSGTSLAALGFNTPGLIASWQLVGVSGDDGRIELRVGAPVPGPLPVFGAAAAFGWSRTLRRRIRGASTTTV